MGGCIRNLGMDILLSDEKLRLLSEYQTMLANVSEILAKKDVNKKIGTQY